MSKSGDDASNSDARLAALLAELEALSAAGGAAVKFEPADFEKDDDDNFHMDFITACTNLRATNYRAFPRSQQQRMMQRCGAMQHTTVKTTGLALPWIAPALVCRHSQGRAAQVQDDRRQDHPGNRDDDRRRLGHHFIGPWSSIRRKKHSSIVLVRRSHGTRHAQRACGAATQAGRAAAQRHLRSWYVFLNLLFDVQPLLFKT